MSALGMVLMAAMAVPGNGPEKVSGEVEPKLVLSGRWEGVMKGMLANHDTFRLRCANGRIEVMHPRFEKAIIRWTVFDEGGGKLHLNNGRFVFLGIYRQDHDSVILCIGDTDFRPTSFDTRNGQNLYILHRVKPGK